MEWQVLESLSAVDRRSLLARCRRRRFPRGGFVFHEGDPGENAHLIDSGTVAVRVTSPMGDVVTLDVLAAGDAFGEQALLGNESTRSATVVALERTDTMCITRDEFEALWENHPDAARAVAAMLDRAPARDLTGTVGRALSPGRDPRPPASRAPRRNLRRPPVTGDPADPGRPGQHGRHDPPDGQPCARPGSGGGSRHARTGSDRGRGPDRTCQAGTMTRGMTTHRVGR